MWTKLKDFLLVIFFSVLLNVFAWWLFLSAMRDGTTDGAIFMFVQALAASFASVFGPIKRFERLGRFYLVFWLLYMIFGVGLLMVGIGELIPPRLLAFLGVVLLVYGTIEELRGRPIF